MAGFRNGLQKVGDTYHYCFRIHGQQYKGSTRARDQKTAKKVLESKRQEALLGAPLIQAEPPTVSALVKDWLLTHAHITCERHRKGVEIMTRISRFTPPSERAPSRRFVSTFNAWGS